MSQRIIVTGSYDEDPFTVFCEPEGNEIEVRSGDVLTFTFEGVWIEVSNSLGRSAAWCSAGSMTAKSR